MISDVGLLSILVSCRMLMMRVSMMSSSRIGGVK